MSITVSTDVFCDVCHVEWVHGGTGCRKRTAEARREARAHGYKTTFKDGELIDVCPKCWQKMPGH